jgi:hypothetical protein
LKKLRQLTEQEFFELQTQFEKTPPPSESFGASGEHYILVALLRRMGFIEFDKWQALKLAERLLSNGYKLGIQS